MMAGFHVLSRHRGKLLADRNRAGERDQPHGFVGDQIFGDVRRLPEHEIEHARRRPAS